MADLLDNFTFLSVLSRLLLAAVAGGIVGYGRSKKSQAAGLRTYIICCVGSTLATLLAFYQYEMLTGPWNLGDSFKYDASRYSAAVISGIGFLAAGSIVRAAHQQIAGLTTAIGLFVVVCMGIAIGVGFYSVVICTILILLFVLEGMYYFESAFKRRTRNLTLLVRFESIFDLDQITDIIRCQGAEIREYEIEPEEKGEDRSAVIGVKLPKANPSHSTLLSSVAELDCVTSVQELIS